MSDFVKFIIHQSLSHFSGNTLIIFFYYNQHLQSHFIVHLNFINSSYCVYTKINRIKKKATIYKNSNMNARERYDIPKCFILYRMQHVTHKICRSFLLYFDYHSTVSARHLQYFPTNLFAPQSNTYWLSWAADLFFGWLFRVADTFELDFFFFTLLFGIIRYSHRRESGFVSVVEFENSVLLLIGKRPK